MARGLEVGGEAFRPERLPIPAHPHSPRLQDVKTILDGGADRVNVIPRQGSRVEAAPPSPRPRHPGIPGISRSKTGQESSRRQGRARLLLALPPLSLLVACWRFRRLNRCVSSGWLDILRYGGIPTLRLVAFPLGVAGLGLIPFQKGGKSRWTAFTHGVTSISVRNSMAAIWSAEISIPAVSSTGAQSPVSTTSRYVACKYRSRSLGSLPAKD